VMLGFGETEFMGYELELPPWVNRWTLVLSQLLWTLVPLVLAHRTVKDGTNSVGCHVDFRVEDCRIWNAISILMRSVSREPYHLRGYRWNKCPQTDGQERTKIRPRPPRAR
jgi:hypothetical protein